MSQVLYIVSNPEEVDSNIYLGLSCCVRANRIVWMLWKCMMFVMVRQDVDSLKHDHSLVGVLWMGALMYQ